MYNDIANNVENPRPGVIINKPDGPDVYKGVPKVLYYLIMEEDHRNTCDILIWCYEITA